MKQQGNNCNVYIEDQTFVPNLNDCGFCYGFWKNSTKKNTAAQNLAKTCEGYVNKGEKQKCGGNWINYEVYNCKLSHCSGENNLWDKKKKCEGTQKIFQRQEKSCFNLEDCNENQYYDYKIKNGYCSRTINSKCILHRR